MNNLEINLQNYKRNNAIHLDRLNPEVVGLFDSFITASENVGIPVWIYSSFRSPNEQAILRNRFLTGVSNIPAAESGGSFHNYGLAVDLLVWNERLNKFDRQDSYDIYKRISQFAIRSGLRWLGSTKRIERHHFDYNKIRIEDLMRALNESRVDDRGFVLFSEVQKKRINEVLTVTTDEWSTNLGSSIVQSVEESEEVRETPIARKITKIDKQNAAGIWQIIKLVSDQYSLSQNVNDATFAHSQGSLLNYINNVVQAPWLQFYGDTVNDQYYFFTRKEPFDFNGWTNLPTTTKIFDDEVLSDDLSWYDGDIFAWYQIIPRGSFLGEQNLIFAYITAVFFEEYAEIWGSKPNIQVSNYVNFTKISGQSNMYQKALEDLRYMVESNAYLPFTKQGTITIRGTTRIKRGYKIFYHPTGEEYYVDSVSIRYEIVEGGVDFITILQVSRGMKIEFTAAPVDADSISYFNIISFDDPPPTNVESVEQVDEISGAAFYFDNSRSNILDLNEDFSDTSVFSNEKIREQISDFPNLRNELDTINGLSLQASVKVILENPQAERFVCKGFIDSDKGINDKNLSRNRALTVRRLIIDSVLRESNNMTSEELESKILVEFDTTGLFFQPLDTEGNFINIEDIEASDNERSLKLKAYERFTSFRMLSYERRVTKEVESEGVNWKVNDEVFQFFINRKQFATE